MFLPRTNLPKEVMGLPDFPFDSSLPSFVHHSDVLHYLEQYAEHYQLYQYIQFYSQVKKVTPIPGRQNINKVMSIQK